jgi:hypothetical protein
MILTSIWREFVRVYRSTLCPLTDPKGCFVIVGGLGRAPLAAVMLMSAAIAPKAAAATPTRAAIMLRN